MENTARLIDLALAETLIAQKESYSSEEYQEYKYELLQCIIGESVIGSDDKLNFHYFTRSNRSRKNIRELGQDGLIIELIKNAVKFDAYITKMTWCKLQCVGKLNMESTNFSASNVVPFIVKEMKNGNAYELITAMKSNINLCEAAIASFVETRYEKGLFKKDLDTIYLENEENSKLINQLDEIKEELRPKKK